VGRSDERCRQQQSRAGPAAAESAARGRTPLPGNTLLPSQSRGT